MAKSNKKIRRQIFGRPWSILESVLNDAIYNLESGKVSMDEMFVIADDNTSSLHQTINDVSVVDINGVILKEVSFMDSLFGGVTSVDDIQSALDEAVAAPTNAIILKINSPGGTVSGVPELGTYLYDIRQSTTKPVIAYGDSLMASAAYWLGSQADEVVVSEGAEIGSIGVIAAWADPKRALLNAGFDVNRVASSDIKGAGGVDGSSPAQIRSVQAQVDKFSRMFKDAVKRGREGMDEEVMDARVVIGQDAVDQGFADSVGTLDEIISQYGSLINKQL
jgi:ClpP class serine protease